MNKSKLPIIKKSSRETVSVVNGLNSMSITRSSTYVVEESTAAQTKSPAAGAANNKPKAALTPIRKEGTFTKTQLTAPQVQPQPQTSPPKMTLAALKQQKRAELKKAQESSGGDFVVDIHANDVDDSAWSSDIIVSNKRGLDVKLREARKSGQLNLSNYGLSEVPDSIWTINEKSDTDRNENDNFNWWDQVNLTKLILASNKLRIIPKNVQSLNSLVILDFHDNQLESVDDAIGTLNSLQSLNISHNSLTSLPDGICKLKQLTSFNVSFNKIRELPKNIGHLDYLEDFNLSNNCLTSIPKSFGWITRLRKLNLSTNSLKTILPEVFYSANLQIVDLSENQIETLSETVSELGNLDQLFARQNRIKKLPKLTQCCKLKDLDFSFNQITEIEENWFDNLMSLINLNLRDNRITNLPSTIEKLQSIQRLDISNNNLTGLPCELAAIESLKQLLVEGNPIRTIRRDVINRGTDAIVKLLRMQLEKSPNKSLNEPKSEEEILKSETIKSSKALDLSAKKLTEITPSTISFCKQSTALALNLSKNQLVDLPHELETLKPQLHELNLAINMFSSIPRPVFYLSNLTSLDLRGNRLTSISNEIARMTALRELILAENRLTEFPEGIYQLPILENLFINSNKIREIDGAKIVQMKHLSTLNLQNNDLAQVPNELGLAHQIKSLQLEGNLFRVPRPEILAKGTVAVLEYLKSRLA